MSMTLRKDDIRVSTFTLLHFKTETLDNFALTLPAVTTRNSRTSTVEYVCTLVLYCYLFTEIFLYLPWRVFPKTMNYRGSSHRRSVNCVVSHTRKHSNSSYYHSTTHLQLHPIVNQDEVLFFKLIIFLLNLRIPSTEL